MIFFQEKTVKLIETRLSENGILSRTVKTGSGIKLYFNPKVVNGEEKEELDIKK